MATNPSPNDPSGLPGDFEVGDKDSDDFASAFASFAAGETPAGGEPAPRDEEDDADGGDTAGHEAAGREDRSSPPNDGTDPQGQARGETPPAGTQAPDPWANASPEIIAERDRLQAALDAAKRSDIASRGRASSLQRQLNTLQAGAASQPQPEPEPKSDGQKALDDKIKQLGEDYPEVAGPLIELLTAQSRELAELKGKVAPVIEADQREAVAEQYQIMESRHPDWQRYGDPSNPEYKAWLDQQPAEVKTINAAYHGWLESQPASIKALAESWDASEASVALTLFKTERAEAIRKAGGSPGDTATDARRQRQLDGGREVGSRAGGVASGAPDDFSAAFAHFSRQRAEKR